MNRYTIKFFSTVEWAWMEYDVLAEDMDDCHVFANEQCKPEYRNKPYRMTGEAPTDSLEIKLTEENITFPFVLREY